MLRHPCPCDDGWMQVPLVTEEEQPAEGGSLVAKAGVWQGSTSGKTGPVMAMVSIAGRSMMEQGIQRGPRQAPEQAMVRRAASSEQGKHTPVPTAARQRSWTRELGGPSTRFSSALVRKLAVVHVYQGQMGTVGCGSLRCPTEVEVALPAICRVGVKHAGLLRTPGAKLRW